MVVSSVVCASGRGTAAGVVGGGVGSAAAGVIGGNVGSAAAGVLGGVVGEGGSFPLPLARFFSSSGDWLVPPATAPGDNPGLRRLARGVTAVLASSPPCGPCTPYRSACVSTVSAIVSRFRGSINT